MRIYTQTNYLCNYLNHFTLSLKRVDEMNECEASNVKPVKCSVSNVIVCMRCAHCSINHRSIFYISMLDEYNSKMRRFQLAQLQAQIASPTPDSWHSIHFVRLFLLFSSKQSYTLGFCWCFFCADDDDTILCGRNTISETWNGSGTATAHALTHTSQVKLSISIFIIWKKWQFLFFSFNICHSNVSSPLFLSLFHML